MMNCFTVLLLLCIILIICSPRDQGFRTQSEKKDLSKRIILAGYPTRDRFRKMGLDGVEYYDAIQLKNNDRFTQSSLMTIL